MIVALAVIGAALHTWLRIPNDEEAQTGHQRPMREIRSNPAFGVALLAATVGYTRPPTPPPNAARSRASTMLVIFAAVGSLLAGALLHTVGWATLNLLMLPLLIATVISTWRWRQPRVTDPRPAPAEAA